MTSFASSGNSRKPGEDHNYPWLGFVNDSGNDGYSTVEITDDGEFILKAFDSATSEQIDEFKIVKTDFAFEDRDNGGYIFATGENTGYKVIDFADDFALIETEINGKKVRSKYILKENGVEINSEAEGEFAFLLPAFHFDGRDYTDISLENNVLKINYRGHSCVYKTNGNIKENQKLSANRNGLYKSYIIDAENSLNIKIEIINRI